MNNSIQIAIEQPNGIDRNVIIQAEWLDKKGYGLEHATSFTVWVTPEIQIGYFVFSKGKKYWKYEGPLSEFEQKQIADFLISYKEADWDL